MALKETDMYSIVRIQVQFLSSNGLPISDWRDQSHLNYPTDRLITSHMQTAKRCWKDARVRAVDEKGRVVDMLYA
jgi:hypothetical protein